jgi:uncharacterized protein (TIRG00374 family)
MRRELIWVGVAVSIAFLVLALRGIDFQAFWRDIQQANPAWLVPGIAVYFVAVALRALRWSFLLRPVQLSASHPPPVGSVPARRIPASRLFPIVVIGYMGNNIYPARIGELLRAYVLRRDHGVAMSSGVSTILIERIMDGIVMVAFVLIGLRAAPNVGDVAARIVALASAAFGLATIVFFWFALAPQAAERLAHGAIMRLTPERFHGRLLGIVQRFVQGAQSLRSPADLAVIVGISALVWLVETVKYWCVAKAFDLNVPFSGLMLVNGLSNLFTIIPGAPGAVGTFDAGGILGMTALGIDKSLAAAYVLTLHVVLWLPVTLLGAYYMLREGLRWSDLRKAEQARATSG